MKCSFRKIGILRGDLPRSLIALELGLLFLDVGSQDAYLVVLVLLEIKAKLFAESKLQQVVV